MPQTAARPRHVFTPAKRPALTSVRGEHLPTTKVAQRRGPPRGRQTPTHRAKRRGRIGRTRPHAARGLPPGRAGQDLRRRRVGSRLQSRHPAERRGTAPGGELPHRQPQRGAQRGGALQRGPKTDRWMCGARSWARWGHFIPQQSEMWRQEVSRGPGFFPAQSTHRLPRQETHRVQTTNNSSEGGLSSSVVHPSKKLSTWQAG